MYLRVRKRGQNTRWVAQQLGRALGLSPRHVSYAGMKDRHAVAEQWFSVQLAGRPDPDWASFDSPDINVLEALRHTRKLRRGMLAGNRFSIAVRDVRGDLDELQARLIVLRDTQTPNFFGAQRFGRGRANLDLLSKAAAADRPADRQARNFGLSALRSALFNGYLDERLRSRTWRTPLPGEILYCADSHACRRNDESGPGDDAVWAPSGLLWGPDTNQAAGEALQLEQAFFRGFPETTGLLEPFAPRLSRRPLAMALQGLAWEFAGNTLRLEFGLQRGQFATVALREAVDISDSATA